MASSFSIGRYRPFGAFDLRSMRLRGGREAAAAAVTPLDTGARPFLARRFDEVDIEVDAADRTSWCWMNPCGAPSFTPSLLADLARYTAAIHDSFKAAGPNGAAPLKHSVLCSRLPGVFNLGGDLDRFQSWIRTRDRDALRAYAYACIDVLHDNAVGFGHGMITIALVQGDALGGASRRRCPAT